MVTSISASATSTTTSASTTTTTTTTTSSTGSAFSFLKLKWRSSKDPKLNIRERLPNSVDDIERDWAGGSEVLDIGCGAGFWSSDMASRYPISYFTGIDIDKNVLPSSLVVLGSSLSRNVFYQRIDLIELPLPYEDATFDFIFMRSMMDTLPDSMWDDVLKELVRVMKKGAYIECVEAYDNLFDAGPLIQSSIKHPPQSPTTPTSAYNTLNNTPTTTLYNPWPNRIANMSQLVGMQINHTHTPVGTYGGTVGSLLLEYWERIISGFRRDWIANKWIAEDELDRTVETMKTEVDEYNTYMSWYSVVAQKKGYNGPTIQFDDVDDFDIVRTHIF
ncbi:hypothetical protein [Parasitella parasitica]|uniref:Methyltransferase domain-containing protein n=1 Tax=Parasitella parasitica TaxID=35722 RepID=A0A0B7NL50_9FUNG|nr:hypothetical protein [Parasitella parasitica]